MIVQEAVSGPLQEYLHGKIGLPSSSELRCIGVQRKDLSIAAAVAYTTWLEDSVFMHVAMEPHALSKRFLREVFTYPFVACGLSRVYGVTPITAHAAQSLALRLGFRPLCYTPDFVLQVMAKTDCRWIDDSLRNPERYAQSSFFGKYWSDSAAAAGSSRH